MLRDHQKEAVEFLLKKRNGAILYEIGLGKTLIALKYFEELKRISPNIRMIVICPLSLIEAAWGEDLKKFTTLTYQNLHEEFSISEKYDIYIMNYQSLLNKKNYDKLSAFLNHYECLGVLDESSFIKSHKSKTTKLILALRNKFKYRVILSGTPAPNIESEYYTQMEFVDPGIFGNSFYKFRNTYFHLERGGQTLIQQGSFLSRQQAREIFSKGWKYAITPRNRELLMERIKPTCLFKKKTECLDLPEEIDENRYVELNPRHYAIYKEMKKELVLELKDQVITAENVLSKMMKLRQITSGFIISNDEPIEFEQSEKLRELDEILEQAGGQAIIWCAFRWEVSTITARLRAVNLYSQTADRDDSINRFKSGEVRYLVAHPRSAGHGLTFVNCSLQVFFSLDYSYETYVQARGRTHRMGQKNPCVYVHILAKDTIDEHLLAVLQRKMTLDEAVKKLLS